MKKLIEVRSQIKALQRQIADGSYGQGKLTQKVNRLNALKKKELEILVQEDAKRNFEL